MKIGSAVSTQSKLIEFHIISLKFGRKSKKMVKSGLPGLSFLECMESSLYINTLGPLGQCFLDIRITVLEFFLFSCEFCLCDSL